jgi:hypothetical protein
MQRAPSSLRLLGGSLRGLESNPLDAGFELIVSSRMGYRSLRYHGELVLAV